jgi:hypothetical protein
MQTPAAQWDTMSCACQGEHIQTSFEAERYC